MSTGDDLLRRVEGCPAGAAGWRVFEDACTATLEYLFVPPLARPKLQPRTYSGIDRRDAVFPNRQLDTATAWGYLRTEVDARLILVEYKNYGTTEVDKEEVNQTRNYLTHPMGRLAILCCNKLPTKAAHIKRNTIYSSEKKVILFLAPEHLREMCFIKERGDEPADLIIDLIEEFYLQHE